MVPVRNQPWLFDS